jgi:hypothetical protein
MFFSFYVGFRILAGSTGKSKLIYSNHLNQHKPIQRIYRRHICSYQQFLQHQGSFPGPTVSEMVLSVFSFVLGVDFPPEHSFFLHPFDVLAGCLFV